MEKQEFEREFDRIIKRIVTGWLFLVIPGSAYWIWGNRFALWTLVVVGFYTWLETLFFPLWIKKNKPKN